MSSTRPKALLKQAKSKSKKEQQLETADDFQAAGVDFEDAAGKWRAGDAVKSMRFFQRAVEVYSLGLQKYPNSFDLAYNKARVELEIATHPILVRQLHIPVLAQLEIALQSHRAALSLDPDNPDVLFNTSQVLTSIAEESTKHDHTDVTDALRLLEEASNLQAQCLRIQELKYDEYKQLQQHQERSTTAIGYSSDQDDGGAKVHSNSSLQEDQWFTIVEPVTADVLIDSILVQLNTLTTLCRVLNSSSEPIPTTTLPWIEKHSSDLLTTKLPALNRSDSSPSRVHEITLTKANFISSLLEAGYRTGAITVETFKQERDAAFSATVVDEDNIELQLADARSLMAFASAVAESGDSLPSANVRWNVLSIAISQLTKASKITGASAEEISQTHLLRGDASLMEYVMGQDPPRHAPAVSNAGQLLKNAEVFYRNASKLSPEPDDKAVAALRSAVSLYLSSGDQTSIQGIVQPRGETWVKQQIEDMSVEGLLPNSFTL